MTYPTSWVRVCTDEDFYDVVDTYENVRGMVLNSPPDTFLEFFAVHKYRINIKKSAIVAFYEHGVDFLKLAWEHNQEMDALQEISVKKEWEI